jgi:hypothetical protein
MAVLAVDEACDRGSGLGLLSRHHVAIDSQRESDSGVPEPFADDFIGQVSSLEKLWVTSRYKISVGAAIVADHAASTPTTGSATAPGDAASSPSWWPTS